MYLCKNLALRGRRGPSSLCKAKTHCMTGGMDLPGSASAGSLLRSTKRHILVCHRKELVSEEEIPLVSQESFSSFLAARYLLMCHTNISCGMNIIFFLRHANMCVFLSREGMCSCDARNMSVSQEYFLLRRKNTFIVVMQEDASSCVTRRNVLSRHTVFL